MVGQSVPLNDPHMNTNVTQPLQQEHLGGSQRAWTWFTLMLLHIQTSEPSIIHQQRHKCSLTSIKHLSCLTASFTFLWNLLFWNPCPQALLVLCKCLKHVIDDESLHQVSCHLLPLAVVGADVGELPADVEQHVVLSRRPLLHKVRGKHPGPENDAVIFKTACRDTRNTRSKQQVSTRLHFKAASCRFLTVCGTISE